jgi:hypothetical protein
MVEHERDRGARTVGVSANPFCSRWFDFDRPFDDFVYTLDGMRSDGLDVRKVTSSYEGDGAGFNGFRRYLTVLREAATHENPTATTYNLLLALLQKATSYIETLERIPHPLFHSNVYLYDPSRNTRAIMGAIEEFAASGDRFFLFSNYMDTHRPYFPSRDYQRAELGRVLSYRNIRRLNEGIGNPQRFIEFDAVGALEDDDLESVRSLYRGGVREVDDHVGRILDSLEANGVLDDTLVVITADHGENLGEIGPRGNRRMGHFESVSDRLLTVPLIVANPSLEPRSISDPVPLARVYDIIVGSLPTESDEIVDTMTTTAPVVSECPATGGEWADGYPDVPRPIYERQTRHHTVVGYQAGTKYAVDTTGAEWAWREGEPVDPEECPSTLREDCGQRLDALSESFPVQGGPSRSSVRDEIGEQLEDLGYL